MQETSLALSEDLSVAAAGAVGILCVISLSLLGYELARRERFGLSIFITGGLAAIFLALAVLRPNWVLSRGSLMGPRVIVLVDESRRLLLPATQDRTRRQVAVDAVEALKHHFPDARLSVLGFGEGEPKPWLGDRGERARLSTTSDLLQALRSIENTPGERPAALVVVSDGRFQEPSAELSQEELRRATSELGLPIHTVRVVDEAPRDASIRAIRSAGAAVAHQPLRLTIDIGCSPGLECGDIDVLVRELRQDMPPAELARGTARVRDGSASVELTITLDRAGSRVVQVMIEPPDGDSIADNNSRIMTFAVTRDRVRLLHVAGRPTYDVRALRMWLKSDESVDLIAFFILRTEADQTNTRSDSELALIPFPVDELFSQHLPSFDAVVLQDLDAVTYGLRRYLPAIKSYVEAGGGVIMVGGPSSFAGGRYAGTELEDVLPVGLGVPEKAFTVDRFVPRYTEAGRVAAVMRPLTNLLGERLPQMPGANLLGPAREGAIVLWEHPNLLAGQKPMPVLALGERRDGRTIALGVDGTHLLAFSELAAVAAGRAYGALWEGLLGWLMRDPRYEVARIELLGECIANEPTTLRVVPVPKTSGEMTLELSQLGRKGAKRKRELKPQTGSGPIDVTFNNLSPGGYTARARLGKAPPARFDFACERGGEAFSDSRPDPDRLRTISKVTGGRSVAATAVTELPRPSATRVTQERHASPLLPAWAWALCAALMLGVHWILRRTGGLA